MSIYHKVKMRYFLKILFIPRQKSQIKYIVMMTKEGATKIVNRMIPGAGILALGCGHISYILKMHYLYLETFSPLFPGIDQSNE